MRCQSCDIATAERRCFVCGRDLEIRGGLHVWSMNAFQWKSEDAGEYPV